MQTTSNLLMIRPVNFKFNQQTANNNKFQKASDQENIHDKAVQEFDRFVNTLRENDLEIIVIDDTLKPETPDSIFPNNWISLHEDGLAIRYPMFSENRRLERREDILNQLKTNFTINNLIDLSHYEKTGAYLEGTGSLVLDRENKIAYACQSIRTDVRVLKEFCLQTGYRSIIFNAVDLDGFPIYHTNVMMCLATQFVVICMDAIANNEEKNTLKETFSSTGKEIIEISYEQMNHFAGNMLQVKNIKNELLLIMSQQAYLSLSTEQIAKLQKYNRIVTSPIDTIEKIGGGSARCMLAEIHLYKRGDSTFL